MHHKPTLVMATRPDIENYEEKPTKKKRYLEHTGAEPGLILLERDGEERVWVDTLVWQRKGQQVVDSAPTGPKSRGQSRDKETGGGGIHLEKKKEEAFLCRCGGM